MTERTAKLPDGWRDRLIADKAKDTNGETGQRPREASWRAIQEPRTIEAIKAGEPRRPAQWMAH